MRIEINAGGLGGSLAISDFQSDMSKFITNVDNVISSFKTVKNEIYDVNGGTNHLQEALDNVEARITLEKNRKEAAQKVQKKADDFLDLVVRIDKKVAEEVNRNKEAFYKTNSWLRPPTSVDPDKVWYEQAWDWLCGTAKEIAKDIKAAWEDSTLKKIWDGLVDFYEKNKFEIINWTVTILCTIASMVIIAFVPGISILLVAAVSAASSAIIAATQSITTQYQQTGSWDGIDWGAVFKDTFIAALVGGATGAIGAGFGGALTTKLSNTLFSSVLNSSSAFIRVTTGFLIGGMVEAGTGILGRGVGTVINGFFKGDISAREVLANAFDGKSIFFDAAIGGFFGGKAEYKQYKADMRVRNFNNKNRPVEKVQDKGYNVKSSKNGTMDYSGSNAIKKNADGEEIIVKIKATGKREDDVKKAWELAEKRFGVNKKSFNQKEVVWQHMDDYNVRNNTFTLQLVDKKAHIYIKHSGGCKQYTEFTGKEYK